MCKNTPYFMREVTRYSSLECPNCGNSGYSREYADLPNPHPSAYTMLIKYFVCTGIYKNVSYQEMGISRAGNYHLYACCKCEIIYAGVIKYY